MAATLDSFVGACLVALAIAAVISGLDDLVLDVTLAWNWLLRHRLEPRPPAVPEKRIAVFVPLWQEHGVIGRMLEHNVEALRYDNYEFFVGAYVNDPETSDAVREAEARYGNVHLAVVPHNGPTSKADCLNWIYQGMLAHEEACGARFAIIVTHDAEDVIHPDSLRWISDYCERYDMVQIPVLPLPTPARQFTHGMYCDEFAEFQTKDVVVRPWLGGFVPSNGVGTGYTRRALEKLAEAESNRVFDPTCLTEDYDCGYRLHRLGFRQTFVPIQFQDGEPVATREYFPQSFRQAVRQRTRWVIGIALQGWERHGWGGGGAMLYWFWRDRKGLVGNPLSLLGNLVSLYSLATWLHSIIAGHPWGLREVTFGPAQRLLLGMALVSQAHRMLVRAACSARLYGWAFASTAPLRSVWANWINAIATVLAIVHYTRTRLARRPHVWFKTEHVYPAQESLNQPAAVARAGVDPVLIPRHLWHALPAHVVDRWKVLPFKIADGQMHLATPTPPAEPLRELLRRHTRLEVYFHLVSAQNFDRLRSGSSR